MLKKVNAWTCECFKGFRTNPQTLLYIAKTVYIIRKIAIAIMVKMIIVINSR